ncbi:Long-chain-fatty-acid--CoA ligase [Anaerovibrio sp. JC8]|uniref:AMP-binding protein n=1 Tax=Anaerovibrio sp. JC8 TaxID=1240085 RepID=UPI000A0A9042|nr:AMP-binding protein [Anaerovibrio sp. JC8]ORU00527.1 Long-chain-fatty-acid--CoA ligase [Anaerovibrio sp. JC8]
MIFDQLEKFGDTTALIEESGKAWSFNQLVAEADNIASLMEKRSLAFLLCRNCVSAVTAYVGALRHGMVPLLLNGEIQDELLEHLLKAYHPKYLWMEVGRKASIGKVLYSDGNYQLWDTGEEKYPINDDLAVLLSTSGSTGSPKLVRQSYKNIMANTLSIAKYLSLTSDDRAITTMPMYYTYGLSIIQTQLFAGGSIVLTEASMFARVFWELLKKYEVTNFGGVPYTYEMLKRMRFGRMDLPSLRFITQAGGKLAADISAEFAKVCDDKGIKFITMYGACEATARMAYLPWEYAQDKAGSIGIAIPEGRLALMDDRGAEITASDIDGELIYYGDNVTLGYTECQDDLSKGDENHGVLHTGDIARRDGDGFYYITGRKKRFLKLFGNRVSLDAVEAYLKSQGYLSCACAGADDKLVVYTTEDINTKELCLRLGEFTHLHSSAFAVVKVEEIPRNSSGKILYESLKGLGM